MSRYFQFFFCLVLVVSFAACDKKKSSSVKVMVRMSDASNARVDLTTPNMLSMDTILLATAKFDSVGFATLEFDLETPVFATIGCSERYIPIYIRPGDQLEITADSSSKRVPVVFTGDESSVNSFIGKVRETKQEHEMMNGKHALELEPDSFMVRRDLLHKELAGMMKNLSADQNVQKETLDLLAIRNKMILYTFDRNYVNRQYGFDKTDPKLPAPIAAALKDLPNDTIALSANMFEYLEVLVNELHFGIYMPAGRKYKDLLTTDARFPEIIENEIDSSGYSAALTAYFKAANLNYLVSMNGLSPELRAYREKFMKAEKKPLYVSTINESFAKWEEIGPGKPARDFTGTTADGKQIALSDLKGKVVYVDIWASWCVPCREEFPESKKLMKEFEDNDKVAFLFVSIDENLDKWKNLLPDKSIPAGVHMNQKQAKQPDAVWENYYLTGIPRYMLINADGTMLLTHAPRPSSTELRTLLKKHVQI